MKSGHVIKAIHPFRMPLFSPSKNLRGTMRLSVTLSGLLIAILNTSPGLSAPSAGAVDVKLKTGTFRGLSGVNGMDKFLGIPFAQPPVGALRFKQPVAITQASNASFNATVFGHACPQPPSGGLGAPVAEDCLFLNVHVTVLSQMIFVVFKFVSI